jgi:hypothetical protein
MSVAHLNGLDQIVNSLFNSLIPNHLELNSENQPK